MNREERFHSSNPFEWTRPKADFQSSNFRKIYEAFPKLYVNEKAVRDCLPYSIQLQWDKFPPHFKVEEKCVRVWTMGSSIYPTLTQALYQDNEHIIKQYIALIRGINLFLVTPTLRDYITYRGSHMSNKQFNVYKVGNIYRAPAFAATSENEGVAEGFKSVYSIKFRIPKNCWNAAPISHVSACPGENEVLLPAYSAFKVLSKSNNRIEVQVLDNKDTDYGVESRFV